MIDAEALKRGVELRKLTKTGSASHLRRFYVTPDETALLWNSKNKKADSSTVNLADVRDIVPGRTTSAFQRVKLDAHLTDLCFSLLLPNRTLDLVCQSKGDFDLWFETLKHLISVAKGPNKARAETDEEMRFVTREWQRAKRDKNGAINVDQVVKLLQKLNLGFSTADIKRMFREVDENNDKVLQFDEFALLFDKLRERPAVTEIFEEFAKSDVLYAPDLHEFLQHTQKDFDVTVDDCRAIIANFTKGREIDGKPVDFMTLVDFTNFLSSTRDNSIFNTPEHGKIYQDMSMPITQYFISSSHNTYLTGDQLRSDSSVLMYQKALELGCRCVELDCWDGDTEPIIYHGHTLTSKITFRSAIETIKEYAFKTSPYPLILSLEVHTSLDQQAQMAAILKQNFGDALAQSLVGVDVPFLPSPEDLKYKVLIKGPALDPRDPSAFLDEEDDDDDDDDLDMSDEDRARYLASKRERAQDQTTAKPKVAKELSDLVYLKNTKFKSCADSIANASSWQMSSFSESKVAKLLKTTPSGFVQYNQRQMSRIYPKGARVDSSNYDPMPAFCCGSQIVALNFQTSRLPMFLNQSKFLDNGGCGYILKPPFHRRTEPFDPALPGTVRKTIKIQLLSGRQLPKPKQSEKGEIIDPYVIVSMHGCSTDSRETRSVTIQNNGFNPQWNETFVFDVVCPQLAVIYFAVYDEDVGSADDFIAYYGLPVTSIRPGYRSIPLLNKDHQAIPFASLFCHISMA